MKVTDLKENEVIHCETLEQYEAICQLLHEAGKIWCDGQPYYPIGSDWSVYEQDTIISPHSGELLSINRHLYSNSIVRKATDFITPTQTKEEYAKERAIGFAKWWVENEILCYKSYYYDNNGNEYRSINELYDKYDEYLKSLLQTQD